MKFRELSAQKIFIPLLYHYWNVPALSEYDELMRHDNWSEDQLGALQEHKLTEMLRYASVHIPYYRDIAKKSGIRAEDIQNKDALSGFPILTKKIIQENFDHLVAPNMSGREYTTEHSGGSTGQPTRVRRSLAARAAVTAATWRANRRMGWELGEPWIWLWGRLSTTQASLRSELLNLYKTFCCQEAFFNIHGLDRKKLSEFTHVLHRFRPRIIEGYTNALYHLCLLIRQEKIVLPKLIGVATTAETLFPEQRKIIEEVLGCKVFNRYASSEVGVIATECSAGNLHIVVENVYIECMGDDGKPAPPGTLGKLLITDLNNRAMPLIRYDLGDAGILASSPCACRLPYPCLEKVIGRLSDILRLPDNKIVFPDDLAEIFYPLPMVKKFQVIQEKADQVRVVVVLKTATADESLTTLIRRNLKTALGEDIEISLEFAEDIPILPSGKHRICISKLPT